METLTEKLVTKAAAGGVNDELVGDLINKLMKGIVDIKKFDENGLTQQQLKGASDAIRQAHRALKAGEL